MYNINIYMYRYMYPKTNANKQINIILYIVKLTLEEIEYNRPFHDNCGPTFIRDIFEWNNDEFAEKSLRHQHI
jgi:hypothetical protein